MATRDHSLDEKIIQAAEKEFLEQGFRHASVRNIAKRAGLTTGALYTRYENKDVLFRSLVTSALKEIGSEFEPMREIYMEAMSAGTAEALLNAIRQEEKIYLNIMFRYYDQCILFFCCSDGSSVEKELEKLMEQKAKQTIAFLQTIAKNEVDFDGVEFILAEQFYYYRKILQRGFSKEKAVSCMTTVEKFMEAGWKDLFERIM